MPKAGKIVWGALSRGLVLLSVLVVILGGAVVAFFFGVTGALSSAATSGPQALLWAQAIAVGALTMLAVMLLMISWQLRRRFFAPLEALRRSLTSATAGGLGEPIWGLDRKDEIGILARAIERLRHSIAANEHNSALVLSQSIERLIKDAARLEADLARFGSATTRASEKIEEASLRAAKASHGAIEAAELSREGAHRIAMQAESKLATMMDALKNGLWTGGTLADAVAQGDREATTAIEGLVCDLEALERYALRRSTIESQEAVALNAALIEAIDRLNAVAERISASADSSTKNAA